MSSTEISTRQSRPGLVAKMAERYGVDADKMLNTLKSTAFRQKDNAPPVTNEQMMALLIVADQYNLNPFTKEIFAYPDKGGIVPVVSVDGWSRIINENASFDGVEFVYSDEKVEHKGKQCHEWIECVIYRKDRSKPTVIREFFSEVCRSVNYATPWDSHPNRMHRHKTLIQGSRVAFGFAGIYDQDEAERIISVNEAPRRQANAPEGRTYLPELSDEEFDANFPEWMEVIESGKRTPQQIIDTLGSKNELTEGQRNAILDLSPVTNSEEEAA